MSSCTPKSFFCDKTVCIPDRYECDGIPDCLNGLDEAPNHCGKSLLNVIPVSFTSKLTLEPDF